MKWIVIPLIKITILLIALVAILLICLWEGSLKELKKLFRKPFLHGDDKITGKYTYQTIKDWLLDRKLFADGGDTN